MRSILRHPEKYALYRELTTMVTATLYHGRDGIRARGPLAPGLSRANGNRRPSGEREKLQGE